jgi:hypothetical protein
MQSVIEHRSGHQHGGAVPGLRYQQTARLQISRRPHQSPMATAGVLIGRILSRRKRFPNWGARKILWLLKRQWPKVRWSETGALR